MYCLLQTGTIDHDKQCLSTHCTGKEREKTQFKVNHHVANNIQRHPELGVPICRYVKNISVYDPEPSVRPELPGAASTSMRTEIGRRTRKGATSSVGNQIFEGKPCTAVF